MGTEEVNGYDLGANEEIVVADPDTNSDEDSQGDDK